MFDKDIVTKDIVSLECYYDARASFYGKATIVNYYNESNILVESILVSYGTKVCKITFDGSFVKMNNYYSLTTMRHINEFRLQNGLKKLTKKEWIELDSIY